MPEFDEIQKAKHYNTDESGVECIDVIKYMSLPRGNAMKYIWRAGKKDPTPEGEIKDLEKAIYYLLKEIEDILYCKICEVARCGNRWSFMSYSGSDMPSPSICTYIIYYFSYLSIYMYRR